MFLIFFFFFLIYNEYLLLYFSFLSFFLKDDSDNNVNFFIFLLYHKINKKAKVRYKTFIYRREYTNIIKILLNNKNEDAVKT